MNQRQRCKIPAMAELNLWAPTRQPASHRRHGMPMHGTDAHAILVQKDDVLAPQHWVCASLCAGSRARPRPTTTRCRR